MKVWKMVKNRLAFFGTLPFLRMSSGLMRASASSGNAANDVKSLKAWSARLLRSARKRVAALLEAFSPSAIVIKKERWDRAENSAHIRSLVAVMVDVSAVHSVPICLVGDDDVRNTFRNLGCETRDEIAAVLSRIFPELLWKLPPKRRPWQSEHPRMAMFDAVALGFAYWQHQSTSLPLISESA